MQKYVKVDMKVGDHAATDWYSMCREVCQCVLATEFQPIGGKGVTVEIDESKFGKMKYGKGRYVKGLWVFGGVERGTNKCFFRVVEFRSKECLLTVIKECILPGTSIISDCWKAYDCLEDEGFKHERVNHSLTYVCPETGAHTNTIEALWSAIKRDLRKTPHKAGEFDSYLAEYMWRKSHDQSMDNTVFQQYLKDIIKVYPPCEKDSPEDIVAATQKKNAAAKCKSEPSMSATPPAKRTKTDE